MRQRLKNAKLFYVFLTAAAVSSLCAVLCGFVKYERVSSCEKQTLDFSDFTLNSIKVIDGETVAATDNDPQIIIKTDTETGVLTFEMESELYTGDIVVYYTTGKNQDFSVKNRAWAHEISDGVYRVDFGGEYTDTVRIDPTSYAGDRMTFGRFTLNDDVSVTDCIAPTYYGAFCVCVISVMVCAVFGIIRKFL